jgi:hypothetical protein
MKSIWVCVGEILKIIAIYGQNLNLAVIELLLLIMSLVKLRFIRARRQKAEGRRHKGKTLFVDDCDRSKIMNIQIQ